MIAQRLEKTIEFDTTNKKITNSKAGQALLDPAPRRGWEQYYEL